MNLYVPTETFQDESSMQKVNSQRLCYNGTCVITLAKKQLLWESVGAFFPRDDSLVSAGKSNSSGVCSLVVRCLLFNPEVTCSNPCVCPNFFTSISKQKGPFFHFFRHYETPSFSFETFFENFLLSWKNPFNFLLIFCNRMDVSKYQKVPSFRFFGTMKLFKILIFLFCFRKLSRVPVNFFDSSQQSGW